MIFKILFAILLVVLIRLGGSYLRRYLRRRKFPNFKDVPIVEGKIPIIGHGLAFQKNVINFVRDCREKYGDVFRIKIFKTDMVVICDRSLVHDYFQIKEKQMSLYNVLKRLYFGKAFSDDPDFLNLIIPRIRNGISIQGNDATKKKILDEAEKMSERLARKDGSKIHISEEMIQFVSQTSARCFTNMNLEGEFFELLKAFTKLLNQIVVLTYFFPHWFLNLFFNRKLSGYRKKMTKLMLPEIQKYRTDPQKNESIIFRNSVDYNVNGRTLTDEEIGNIIVCLLYVSSENTALGLTAALTDLACNPSYWEKVQKESASNLQHYLTTKDLSNSKIFSSSLIKACVMETARINTHIFPIARKPESVFTLGNYYMGEVDAVALCVPMFMAGECAKDKFESPKDYNPERYLSGGESYDPESVMTWGAGPHGCPGKDFAIFEIMAAIAMITTKFEKFNLTYETLEPLDYFSPSAFAERKNLSSEIHKISEKNVEIFLDNEERGWLLRNCIPEEEQKQLLQHTFDILNETPNFQATELSGKKPVPLAFDNLVYTGTSNCRTPSQWYDWAQRTWKYMVENGKKFNFQEAPVDNFNSFYAQLFPKDSSMAEHKDEIVTWGISVSIGASCEFKFGKHNIVLNSGDVFIADFSKVLHSVEKIFHETRPQWAEKMLGCGRFSVQIRRVTVNPDKLLSKDEFVDKIRSR